MGTIRKGRMVVGYFDVGGSDEYECVVRFPSGGADRLLTIEYTYQGQRCLYRGEEKGSGHYHLQCAENGGEATIHHFEAGLILEGYWQESSYHGFWRIHLSPVEAPGLG